MKALKQISTYLIWIVVSIIFGIVYMRIILGSNEISTQGLWNLLHFLLDLGLLIVGVIIGVVVAFLFIILDIFYLKKKLENNIKSTSIRFMTIAVITCVVGVIHYILEKVIDVI